MPSNNTGKIVKELYAKYPDKIAMLNTPQSFKTPIGLWALDNGCYTQFNEYKYFNAVQKSKKFRKPMFIVAPDVVGCHDRTLALWKYYSPILKEKYNYPIAFVAQDGCTPQNVPKNCDWIFVGGKDPWKMRNVHKFIGDKPVHVGRVNTIKRLEYCESLGVTSVDGTGWVQFQNYQTKDLIAYLEGRRNLCLF